MQKCSMMQYLMGDLEGARFRLLAPPLADRGPGDRGPGEGCCLRCADCLVVRGRLVGGDLLRLACVLPETAADLRVGLFCGKAAEALRLGGGDFTGSGSTSTLASIVRRLFSLSDT